MKVRIIEVLSIGVDCKNENEAKKIIENYNNGDLVLYPESMIVSGIRICEDEQDEKDSLEKVCDSIQMEFDNVTD